MARGFGRRSLIICLFASGCLSATATTPESGVVSEPRDAQPHPPQTCRPGYHLSDGHCCLEGAEWIPARDQCYCLESSGCPEPVEPVAEAVVDQAPPDDANDDTDEAASSEPRQESCPEGQVRNAVTQGHCCWPEQVWSTDASRCTGAPVCPLGQIIEGDNCIPGEIPHWIEVPPGSYVMGSPPDELHRFADEGQHRVTLTKGLAVAATEVTQSQFENLMGFNPSRFDECGDHCPVEQVSWHQAAAYCNALSARQELEPCYRCQGQRAGLRCAQAKAPAQCAGFRLPTESEWEYLARAGSTEPRYGEDVARVAWYRGNSQGRTRRVATREPNAWGLYDVLGNVMEWCHDWFGDYPDADVTNPVGPDSGEIRVVRGGSWIINEWRVRAAYRYRFPPEARVAYVGFRPVRSL